MEELRNYIRFLYGQYMEEKEQNRQQQAAMQESLDEMAKQLKEANANARLESKHWDTKHWKNTGTGSCFAKIIQ